MQQFRKPVRNSLTNQFYQKIEISGYFQQQKSAKLRVPEKLFFVKISGNLIFFGKIDSNTVEQLSGINIKKV